MKKFLFVVMILSMLLAGNSRAFAKLERVPAVSKTVAVFDAVKLRLVSKATRFITVAALACGIVSCDNSDRLVDPEHADSHIKIGMIYSGAHYPESLLGARLAATQWNSAGGINGAEIVLLSIGTHDFVKFSELSMQELVVNDEVQALIGLDLSEYALLAGEVAQQLKTPLVTTAATDKRVAASSDYVFMTAFTDNQLGQTAADLAWQELGATTAAVLVKVGDGYSETLAQTFIERFIDLGGAVLAMEGYTEHDNSFSAQIPVFAKASPEMIFIPSLIQEAALFAEKAKMRGVVVPMMGAARWDSSDLAQIDRDALEGSLFVTFFSPDAPAEQLHAEALRFINSYRDAYNTSPDLRAALAYDALHLVAQAMQRTGGELDGAAIRNELAATHDYYGATFLPSFYKGRRLASEVTIIKKITDGQAVFYRFATPQ